MSKIIKVKECYDYIEKHPKFTGCLIDKYNDIYWFKNGLRHREDGPAVEWADGDKEWYQNGLRHREDGPALEYASGAKYWYLNDIEYSEQKWIIAMRKIKLEKVLKEIDC